MTCHARTGCRRCGASPPQLSSGPLGGVKLQWLKIVASRKIINLMKNLSYLLSILAFVSLLLSCNDDKIVNSNGMIPGLLPMRNGNNWNYRRTWLDLNKTAIDTFNISMTMYGPDTVGTFVGYGIKDFFWPFSISLLANETDGLYAIDDPSELPIPITPSPPPIAKRAILFPTQPGDTLRFKMLLTKTKAIGQSLTVPAGRFDNCVVYDFFEGDSLAAEAYVLPHVGVIRIWAIYGNQIQMNDLTSYSIE